MPLLTDAIKREVGQHFVFGFDGYEVNDSIRTLIRDYHLGSVILMKRNVLDAQQVRQMVKELQTIAKESGHEKPLLIGTDQENGLVSAFSSPTAGTQFPGAMAIAATGSPDLAREISAATGKELRMVGINWVYSPIADVNSEPRNPVIGVRSFGEDPRQVLQYSSAIACGLSSAGVAPTAKHFPGHGDTHVDSHLALPRIEKTKEQLEKTELVPFRGLVEVVPSIMTGHMALPQLTNEDVPASLSPQITREVLRGQLGFKGVIVTDCLEMEAVASLYSVPEAAVMAFKAGADIAMVCHRFDRHLGSMRAVYEAVESGRLDLEELRKGGERIGSMKDAFAGSWEDVFGGAGDEAGYEARWEEAKRASLALSKMAYERSCTVVWGAEMLPLRLEEGKGVVLYTPEMESLNAAVDDMSKRRQNRSPAGEAYLAFAGQAKARVRCEHIVYSPRTPPPEKLRTSVEAVIFVLRNANQREWQKERMRRVLQTGARVVLVSSCGPYDLVGEDVRRDGTAYMQTFEFTIAALEECAAKIFGK